MAGFSTIDFLPQNCLFGRYSKAPPLSHSTYKVIDDVDASVNGFLEKQREDVKRESIRWHGTFVRKQSDIKEYAAALATKKKRHPASACASGFAPPDTSRDRLSSINLAVKPGLFRPGVGLKAGARRAAGTRHDFLAKVASSSLRSSDRLTLLAKRLKQSRSKGRTLSAQDLLAATRAACKIHHGMPHFAMHARKRPTLEQSSKSGELDRSRAKNCGRDRSRSRSQPILREDQSASYQLAASCRMDGSDDGCHIAKPCPSDSKRCKSRLRNLDHACNHADREQYQNCKSDASDDEHKGWDGVEMYRGKVGNDSDRSYFRDDHECHSCGDERRGRSSGSNEGRHRTSYNSDGAHCRTEGGGHSWGDEECYRSEDSECHSMDHELGKPNDGNDVRCFPDGEERNGNAFRNCRLPRSMKVANAEDDEANESCSIKATRPLADCEHRSNDLPCADGNAAEQFNLKLLPSKGWRRVRRRRRLNAPHSNSVLMTASLVPREKAQTSMTGTFSQKISTSQGPRGASCFIEREQSLPLPSPPVNSVVVLDEESDADSSDVEIQELRPPLDYALQIDGNSLGSRKSLGVPLPPPTIVDARLSCRVPAPDYAPWV